MFTITIETNFNASHQLTYQNGTKEDLHCHNWCARVAVSTETLNQDGLAIDFVDLKAKIDTITSDFQGAQLEKLPCFAGVNASAEIVAQYLHRTIKPLLPLQTKLLYTEVMEAPGCWAKFSR